MRFDDIDEGVAGPEKCWPGYRKVGTKPGTGKNAGKRVNDCEKIKEGISDEVDSADVGEYDREGEMAQSQLQTAEDAASELRSILDADENLPEWVQSKITKAVDYLDTARDYMKSEKQGVAEGLDNYEFHTSVEKGEFLPSKFGNKRFVYLHDLNKKSPSTGGPQLVTIDDADAARQIASQYGGKVVKTKLDTFRIVKPAEQSVVEYGDTAKGQKMLTKVQKRAVDRVVSKKADTDPAYARKNKDTADRAWDRMKDVAEAAEDTFVSALKGLKSWQVVIMNNYYRGKYSDYSGRYYYVLATSPEEARQVVLDNADAILQDLLSMKSINGKKILPRGSAVPITDKRIGEIKDGTEAGRMTTAGFKKMFSPQGPMMVKLANGAIADVQGQEQGVAEVSDELRNRYVARASDDYGSANFAARASKSHPGLEDYSREQERRAEKRRAGLNRALSDKRTGRKESVAEGSDNIRSMIQQYEDMVELVYDLPPGRKKNIAIDKRDALEAQIEAMPGGSEALRQWAKSYNDAMDEGVAEGPLHNPGVEDSPVAQAIIRRILMQRTDLLAKYGPGFVGQAVDDVADSVGEVDEIGSSDVSGWVKQVEWNLKNKINQYDEPMENKEQNSALSQAVKEAGWGRRYTSYHDQLRSQERGEQDAMDYSRRAFKRAELQHELGHEDDPDFERKQRQQQIEHDRGPWYIRIDGKIYRQKGEPKSFDWKKGANNYALAMIKNNPSLKGRILLSKSAEDK